MSVNQTTALRRMFCNYKYLFLSLSLSLSLSLFFLIIYFIGNVFLLLAHFGKVFRRLTSISVRIKQHIGYITCTNGTSSSLHVFM